MRFGLDFLGLAKYADIAKREFPQGWALGAFSNTFGNALPAVESILNTGRCPEVRLHLWWEDDHKLKPDTFKKIEAEAKRVGAFYAKFPKILCKVSGFCEHTLNLGQATELRDLVVKNMPPHVIYVNSASSGATLPNCINEIHGNRTRIPSGSFDYSYDGQSAVDAPNTMDKNKYGKAGTFYFWIPQFNGRLKMDDPTPRPQRKAWPVSQQIDGAIYLSTEEGSDIKLPKGWIYKSYSDQHTTPPAGKDQKPVWICPIKAPEILLQTRNGQVVDRARYYGTYQGGGYRYYGSDWCYLTAEKARRIQGDPLCEVFIGGKKVGVVNPAFRAGQFR